jgi:hypothetical protein
VSFFGQVLVIETDRLVAIESGCGSVSRKCSLSKRRSSSEEGRRRSSIGCKG